MTPERQKQIEELRGRITPDEWDLCLDLPSECGLAWCRSHQEIQLSHAKITIHKDGYAGADYDAEFIAAAPQIVDELLSALREVTEERDRLAKALRDAIDVADDARREWDAAPSGMRAGKIIIALSGKCPGYTKKIDAIHAALSPSPSTTEGQLGYEPRSHRLARELAAAPSPPATGGDAPEWKKFLTWDEGCGVYRDASGTVWVGWKAEGFQSIADIHYASGLAAGMERAAVICDGFWDEFYWARTISKAIRDAAQSLGTARAAPVAEARKPSATEKPEHVEQDKHGHEHEQDVDHGSERFRDGDNGKDALRGPYQDADHD